MIRPTLLLGPDPLPPLIKIEMDMDMDIEELKNRNFSAKLFEYYPIGLLSVFDRTADDINYWR